MKTCRIALAGNPNSGKTTLFNALTGANHYVGNWAGVTVEKREGSTSYKDNTVAVTDLPGIYSISPYSIEEKITRNFIIEDQCDVVVNIVDASFLERNLFLSTQLLELQRPMVIALNMMDEAKKKGIKIDIEKLSKELGVAIVPIIARNNEGIDKLLDVILETANKSENNTLESNFHLDYGVNYEKQITDLTKKLSEVDTDMYNLRWLSIKLIESDEELADKFSSFSAGNEDFELYVTNKKYEFITKVLSRTAKMPKENYDETSSRIDKYLLNRFIGIPLFAAMMTLVFYLTFTVGGVFQGILDEFFSVTVSGLVTSLLAKLDVASWMISLIVDGVIGGVGGVLTFVPNIAILFIAISLLEDSGYMARVAFLMDKWMSKVGLSGKTFIPMILGFGCNVPAIMGARTLESENDRLLAILINPFMSCGARFPVYVLFVTVFFPNNQTLVMISLYSLGVAMALIFAYIFRKTIFKGEQSPFIMELPPYRFPNLKTLAIHVWEKVKGYVVKAGTVIFGASVILWFVLNFNQTGMVEISESYGAMFGEIMAPVFAPLGFGNWQSALSLISGIAAKEIVIANMSILYGLGEGATTAQLGAVLSTEFTKLSAYAFMVFVLLYTPCVAVIGVIKRETNSWKWTIFSVVYQLLVAWFMAMLVFQIGSLFFA